MQPFRAHANDLAPNACLGRVAVADGAQGRPSALGRRLAPTRALESALDRKGLRQHAVVAEDRRQECVAGRQP